MGVAVNSFTKEPVVYDITLTVRGKEFERKQFLNKLTNAFEYDVVNLSPGRIYYGKYYIDGYIKKSSNEVSGENNSRTDCKIEIYCPYPFWSMEQEQEQYFKGTDEIVEIYDSSGSERDDLLKNGIKKLEESKNKTEYDMTMEKIEGNMDVGDVVGGRDYLTGASMKKPIGRKIWTISEGKEKIEYKLEGES